MDDVYRKFLQHAQAYKARCSHMSFPVSTNEDYQAILAMGQIVIPYLLHEIVSEGKYNYLASTLLWTMIPDPPKLKPEHFGRLSKFAEYWRIWGEQHGYLMSTTRPKRKSLWARLWEWFVVWDTKKLRLWN